MNYSLEIYEINFLSYHERICSNSFNSMLLFIDFLLPTVLTDWEAARDEIRSVKSKSILLYKQSAITDKISSQSHTLDNAFLENESIEDSSEPKMFGDNTTNGDSTEENIEMFNSADEHNEDDFEIPAFLRKQKF